MLKLKVTIFNSFPKAFKSNWYKKKLSSKNMMMRF